MDMARISELLAPSTAPWEETELWAPGVRVDLPVGHPMSGPRFEYSSLFVSSAAAWEYRVKVADYITSVSGDPSKVSEEQALAFVERMRVPVLVRDGSGHVIDIYEVKPRD